jgi:NAD(P)-dependent dehydrogenase (short-subunit alcohol dehydrogenase family)
MPGIDLLVNNAGTYADVPFLEMSVASFERTMRLNVASYFFLTQAFARTWVAQGVAGRVLMIGSINGRLAEPTHAAYDTSKGAVEMMVRSLCVELAPHGIRVNGLAPGLFVTPLTARALSDPRQLAWMRWHTPNGQVPAPDVAGEAAVFLLSDTACHIHGHMLLVDGGMSVWQQPDPPSGPFVPEP